MCELFKRFVRIFSGGDKSPEDKIQEEKERVKTWHDRAQMAYQQKNLALAAEGLKRKFEHACKLAEFEGTPRPERPEDPEKAFGPR